MSNAWHRRVSYMKSLIVGLITVLCMSSTGVSWADGKDRHDGNDADLQAWSIAIDSPPRFVVLKEFNGEAVLDRETQLVWERRPVSAFGPDFQGSVRHCYERIIGGRLGWRLPTVDELTSLLVQSHEVTTRGELPHGHPFIGVSRGEIWYWSITAGSFTTSSTTLPVRFIVAMNEPQISTISLETNLHASHPSWCVRGPGGGQSSREP